MTDHSHGKDNAATRALIPEDEHARRVAECFARLGDPTRLKIFCLLCHSEECVMNIAQLIEMSSPAVAHHLRLLKEAGLIVSRRLGKEMYYRLADTPEAIELHRAVDTMFNLKCAKL